MRQFAITDIHGCLRSFEALLDKIGLDLEDELYLLGDYVDRGPDSKGVIDHIFALREQSYTVYCLIGNHEAMMLASTQDNNWSDTWLDNGGWTTLQSFGVTAAEQISDEYFNFFLNLPYYFEVGNYLLVHAGLNFLDPEPLQDQDSMLWIRDWYEQIDRDWLGGRVIVHGHTPVPREIPRQQLEQLNEEPVLDIDCGCVFTQSSRDVGYLCAFDMTNRKLYFQKNIEAA
jgi:serine/threonine protein phosphatase 1